MEEKDLYILVSATTIGRGRVDLKVVRALERIGGGSVWKEVDGVRSEIEGIPVSEMDGKKEKKGSHDVKESRDAISDRILQEIRGNVDRWVDEIGRESADAQNLKLPITTAEKLKQKAPGHDSPDKFNDYLYLLLKTATSPLLGSTLQPIGFIRVGDRSLFLVKPDTSGGTGRLVHVDPCFCALDFYCRIRRSGFGLFLFKQALNLHGKTAEKVAFDRPTASMISFLSKHFNLTNPIEQPNHFVIFEKFF